MLLAAGLGTRMRPLTLTTPKPLLAVRGRALIDWHLDALAAVGVRDVVVNVSWHAQQIIEHCEGDERGLDIAFSREAEPLETAGGIIEALPMLGEEPFMVLNADIWTDYPLEMLAARELPAAGAHLVLVDNPAHHPGGDFSLIDGRVVERQGPTFTFSGLGLYHPRFFEGYARGKRPLRPLLERAIADERLRGEHYAGRWTDVGTPERLAQLDETLKARR